MVWDSSRVSVPALSNSSDTFSGMAPRFSASRRFFAAPGWESPELPDVQLASANKLTQDRFLACIIKLAFVIGSLLWVNNKIVGQKADRFTAFTGMVFYQ